MMKKLFAKYRDDMQGLLWLAGALIVGLSLVSYAPTDPSFNAFVSTTKQRNLCGYFGSFLADLLYQGFGLPAWILVFGFLRQAYLSFTSLSSKRKQANWWLDLCLLLCGSALLSLHLGHHRFFANHIRVGGWLGQILVSALLPVLNKTGLGVLLWMTLAGLLVFYTEQTWSELIQAPRATLGYYLRRWTEGLSLLLKQSLKRLTLKPPEPKIQRSASVPANPSLTEKVFFRLQASENEKNKTAVQSLSKPLNPPPENEIEPDNVPITGFLKETLKITMPQKRNLSRLPRRVANWELPKLSMLEDPPNTRTRLDEREIKGKARLLVEKLAQFSVRGEVMGIKPGPAVTMFEFKPAVDVKISKITELADDLSLALSSESVRIIAPIPGRDVVGIETSNSQRESVFAKDIISQEEFWANDCKLPLALGRKADGEPKIVDLRKMPHLLVAGTTGSGKSVFIVSMITGLLFRHSPKTLKLILVDPKQVDLAAFNDIPHLIMPPIREPKKAVGALRWAIKEMEKRYRSMSKFGARGLEAFNEATEAFSEEKIAQHSQINESFEGAYHPEAYYFQPLPYIVIVVEEFGDLMVVDKINVEQAVVRLAQMARACGIHLVLAMQSPRKDVVTGLIKTNIPGRISFKVASKMDSRIILDEGGAERLLARGDMLFLAPGVSKPERHHGPFLSETEINTVSDHWREQGEPEFDALALKAIEGSGGGFEVDRDHGQDESFDDGEIKDDRYDEVLAWVASQKEVSASLLQRKFRLGYPRAARIIEIFEAEGVVGPANGSKPRQVMVRDFPNP